MFDWIYRTKASFKGHLIVGTLLLFLLIPASAIDIFIAPDWYVWHPECDNPNIAMGILIISPFWLLMSGFLSSLLCYFCVKGREGGRHILDFPFRPSITGVVWNVILLPLVAALLFITVEYLKNAGVTVTQTVDCGGTAEPITSTRSGPIFQLGPFLSLCLAIWVLHIRSLASTSYTPTPEPKT